MKAETFRIAIPDSTLTDLRERLARTRWAEDFANEGWAYGTSYEYLKRLVDYWQGGFDWRRQEAAINEFSLALAPRLNTGTLQTIRRWWGASRTAVRYTTTSMGSALSVMLT